MRSMKKVVICLLILLLLPINVDAKRGCCSHHGGVNHCGNSGYYICNDGAQSPTCTCNAPVKNTRKSKSIKKNTTASKKKTAKKKSSVNKKKSTKSTKKKSNNKKKIAKSTKHKITKNYKRK